MDQHLEVDMIFMFMINQIQTVVMLTSVTVIIIKNTSQIIHHGINLLEQQIIIIIIRQWSGKYGK